MFIVTPFITPPVERQLFKKITDWIALADYMLMNGKNGCIQHSLSFTPTSLHLIRKFVLPNQTFSKAFLKVQQMVIDAVGPIRTGMCTGSFCIIMIYFSFHQLLV